ncbi:hypothetical protein B0T20DRAFT_484429 [Sordaria brevicollis]|uniref:Uncharacterized protein n=1 Tax=Sordaria brevicollis TaxID=83679 RepID=A0AAE0NV79_SORBR|nr:hypothetical protein B0T20DRAFT_484429 [Sordaria brevicollis]
MVNNDAEKSKELRAIESFKRCLTKDCWAYPCWQAELSEALRSLAFKYEELSPLDDTTRGVYDGMGWHNYFILSLQKLMRGMPSDRANLNKALKVLRSDEAAAEKQDLEAEDVMEHVGEAENESILIGSYGVDTNGSITVTISDDTKTSSYGFPDCGSALVDVKIYQKHSNAPAL